MIGLQRYGIRAIYSVDSLWMHLVNMLPLLPGSSLPPCAQSYILRYDFGGTTYSETIASYGTRFVVCDIRAWSFT